MLSSTSARYIPYRVLPGRILTAHQRVAYVYRAKRKIEGSNVRVIWGYVAFCSFGSLPLISHNSRVSRSHGNSGAVKAKFTSNIPPHAFGASVRVVRILCIIMQRDLNSPQMMYPSTI